MYKLTTTKKPSTYTFENTLTAQRVQKQKLLNNKKKTFHIHNTLPASTENLETKRFWKTEGKVMIEFQHKLKPITSMTFTKLNEHADVITQQLQTGSDSAAQTHWH